MVLLALRFESGEVISGNSKMDSLAGPEYREMGEELTSYSRQDVKPSVGSER